MRYFHWVQYLYKSRYIVRSMKLDPQAELGFEAEDTNTGKIDKE